MKIHFGLLSYCLSLSLSPLVTGNTHWKHTIYIIYHLIPSPSLSPHTGTSNWSADYFINTGGIGLVINETDTQAQGQGSANKVPEDNNGTNSARQQLQALFERDWHSQYAKPLEDFVWGGLD